MEEIERQKKDGHSSEYNFIRDLPRYDLGDYPVFYFERLHGIIFMAKSWAVRPEFFLNEEAPEIPATIFLFGSTSFLIVIDEEAAVSGNVEAAKIKWLTGFFRFARFAKIIASLAEATPSMLTSSIPFSFKSLINAELSIVSGREFLE